MTHNDIRQSLKLLVYDELPDQERAEVETHVAECPECRAELEQLKTFLGTFGERGQEEPSTQLLNEARENLRKALLAERSAPPFLKQTINRAREFLSSLQLPGDLPRYAFVLGGICIFVVGGLLGYGLFSLRLIALQPQTQSVAYDEYLKGANYEISNVHFLKPDTSDGNVEASFDATHHLRIKGNLNDEPIRKLLTYALVNESNAGVRLKSIDLIKAFQFKSSDTEMKSTLVKVLKSDENAGVRREALTALEKFSFDDTVKDAFLFVLANDANPGLRIAAIDGLVTKVAGQIWDETILRTLRDKMQSDDNKYIRVRAKNILEDIREQ